MVIAGIIALITVAALVVVILVCPTFRVGRMTIGTYWIVAALGAVATLAVRAVDGSTLWHSLTATGDINPLKILALFFSMTFLSVMLDEVGLFRYLAARAVRLARANQTALFAVLYALTALLTVFTSNDVVILTLTPFICFFCRGTHTDPIPYLVGEFAAANTWSMLLVIGNPTNIYLATSAGIGFLPYLKVMALPTLAAGVVEFGVLLLLFWRKLRAPLEPQVETCRIDDRPDLVLGLVHIGVCLVLLVLSGYIGLPMWIVASACAVSLLIGTVIVRLVRRDGWARLGRTFARLPWQLVPFVLSMFVIVVALDTQGVSAAIGAVLGEKACVWTYGGASYLASNLINNIPMSILFSTLPAGLPETAYRQAIYASVVGSNIGAFLTPIGALAGIMFTNLTAHYEVRYGFRRFVGYGAAVSVPTLAACLGVLALLT